MVQLTPLIKPSRSEWNNITNNDSSYNGQSTSTHAGNDSEYD